ncbi:hypothetical protein Tco_0720977 [Tanacetum coccineum]
MGVYTGHTYIHTACITLVAALEDSTVTYTECSGPYEPQAPPLPGFVPEPVYPEFMPLEDESNPEEDDEDPEEDPADYPTDRDNDDDKDDEEPSGDDADDEEEDEDEEEEHPAPADSVLPPVERLLALPTTPPSLLTLLSSPLPQIPSPPLPVSPLPTTLLVHSSFWLQSCDDRWTPPLLLIPLPTPSPPLFLTSTNSRADAPEVTLLPRKRLCIALGLRFEVDDEIMNGVRPERMLVMSITTTWMRCSMACRSPATDETKLGWRVTDLVTTVRQGYKRELYEAG